MATLRVVMSTLPEGESWSWLPRGIQSTRWSLISRLREPGEAADQAAEEICRIYWYPLYVFALRKGYGDEDARDHVQSFLTRALEKRWFERAHRERGQFRSYIRTLFLHHISAVNAKAGAKKRGGGARMIPYEWSQPEEWLEQDRQLAELDPEAQFNRLLSIQIFDEALAALRGKYLHNGEAVLFEEFLPALEGPLEEESYADVAARVGKSPNAVKVAVSRFRERFRRLLRECAARALGCEAGAEVDDELREIFR